MTKRGHAPFRPFPDLAREGVPVVRDRIPVVELVGRVMAGVRRELGRPLDHVVDVPSGHARATLHRRDDVELGTESPHELETLLREAIGDHDQAAVALRAADKVASIVARSPWNDGVSTTAPRRANAAMTAPIVSMGISTLARTVGSQTTVPACASACIKTSGVSLRKSAGVGSGPRLAGGPS